MRVLIVKTSSLSDIIHTLPALSEAAAACPGIVFDWVVEEEYVELPQWHPAVDRVIPIAIRRWRKNIFKAWHSAEWKQFRGALRKYHYDLVVDAQGLLKSAWVTRFVKAPTAGFDYHSSRERAAAFLYHRRYAVAQDVHAVQRIRTLFSEALNYPMNSAEVSFGLDTQQFTHREPRVGSIVVVPDDGQNLKKISPAYWRALIETLVAAGYQVKVPSRLSRDRDQAREIVAGIAGAKALPVANLKGLAGVLAEAQGIVAADGALCSLSAALNLPTVSLFCAERSLLAGPYGQLHCYVCEQTLASVPAVPEPIAESGVPDSDKMALLAPVSVLEKLQSTISLRDKGILPDGAVESLDREATAELA